MKKLDISKERCLRTSCAYASAYSTGELHSDIWTEMVPKWESSRSRCCIGMEHIFSCQRVCSMNEDLERTWCRHKRLQRQSSSARCSWGGYCTCFDRSKSESPRDQSDRARMLGKLHRDSIWVCESYCGLSLILVLVTYQDSHQTLTCQICTSSFIVKISQEKSIDSTPM